jgi:hypothetical protein
MNQRVKKNPLAQLRTGRRRLLHAGGILAGSASFLGSAAAEAAPRDHPVAGVGINERRKFQTPTWRPDPTLYPSPAAAIAAPAETLAYVIRVNPTGDHRCDAICVIDVDPESASFGTIVGETEMSAPGDELHHFG